MILSPPQSGARPAYGPSKGLDWWLIAATCILLFFGLTALHSVDSARYNNQFFPKQVVFAFIGFVLMVAAALIRPDVWRRFWPWLYGVNILLLLAVILVGKEGFGAQRWIDIGPMQLQPSEFTKILMALSLAGFFTANKDQIDRPSVFIQSGLLVLPVVVLLLLQPHLGATMCIVMIWVASGLSAGVGWKWPVGALLGIIVLLGAAFASPKLPERFEYMKERLVAKLRPDEKGNAYQQNQAVTAIGAGQLMGAGLNRGEKKSSGFIPMQHNDFIFTVVGEEGGFVGSAIVLLAYGFFFFRVWWTGVKARSTFGRLVSVGLLAVLSFHTVVNIGMNLGLTPVVGLWLPFMSSGGTALWMCMISVGLLLAIHRFDTET